MTMSIYTHSDIYCTYFLFEYVMLYIIQMVDMKQNKTIKKKESPCRVFCYCH